MESKAQVLIDRFKKDSKETLSAINIVIDGVVVFICVGLELPWLNNQKGVSCIFPGSYKGRKVGATKNIPYKHIAIDGVEGRDGICMHIVNFVRQLRGCVGVGERHIDIDGDDIKDVTNSKNTFDKIMEFLPDNFDVIITENE